MNTVPELISLVLAMLTMPWCVGFLVLYARDNWWRHWFGRSLMAIAVGVLVSCCSLIIFRLYGPLWWLPWLSVVIWSLVLFGMVARTLVLWFAQRRDRDRDNDERTGERRASDWQH